MSGCARKRPLKVVSSEVEMGWMKYCVFPGKTMDPDPSPFPHPLLAKKDEPSSVQGPLCW